MDDQRQMTKRICITGLVGALVVIVTGLLVRNSSFDFPVTRAFNELNTGFIGSLVTAVYHLFATKPAIVWIVGLSVIIWVCFRSFRTGAVFGLTVFFSWLGIAIMKIVFARARPDKSELPNPSEFSPADFSFPSGHTGIVTITLVALIIVTTGTKVQMIPRIVAPILIVLIIFTVLTLGVHFPTDALASLVWGLAVTPVVWLALSALFRLDPGRPVDSPIKTNEVDQT